MNVFGQIFVDFDTAFTITDTDGEPPASTQIGNVILDESGESGPVVVVKALEDHGRHGLETNDVVTFSRLRGISENLIQNDINYVVTVTGPYTFQIKPNEKSATTVFDNANDNNNGHVNQQGYITQVKQPKTVAHTSYRDATARNVVTNQPDLFV